MPTDFVIRSAIPSDVPEILGFISALADYEHMLDQVETTEDMLRKWLFEEKKAEVAIAEAAGEAVGFALFFTSFSTFLGKPGLFLEDLFVKPECRGNGYGTMVLQYLANQVIERGYGRLEWACLDWNKPSIGFYLSLGAVPMDEWTTYRISGEALVDLATEA